MQLDMHVTCVQQLLYVHIAYNCRHAVESHLAL